jgi:hypothetical protein
MIQALSPKDACQYPPAQVMQRDGQGDISLFLNGSNLGDTHLRGYGIWGIWTPGARSYKGGWTLADSGLSSSGSSRVVDGILLAPGARGSRISGLVMYRDRQEAPCQTALN